MGRPRGRKNNKTLMRLGVKPPTKAKALKMGLVPPVLPESPEVDNRSDEEIVSTIEERFEVFWHMMKATVEPTDTAIGVRALIVSGAPGVGKTYTAEQALDRMKENRGASYHVIRGGEVSAIGLYKTAYAFRNPGQVLLMDDADCVFTDEPALNILKCLLDTSLERKVSWVTESYALRDDHGDVPQEFKYDGSIVFLTNKDFQAYIDRGKGSYVEHMEALMSRAIYLDLRMHVRREVALWVKNLVMKKQILQMAGLMAWQEKTAVDWVISHRDDLRELSIRTALKVGTFMKMREDAWERLAEVTLLRKPKAVFIDAH